MSEMPLLSQFKVGDRVERRVVDKRLARAGVVVSVFSTLDGDIRYVIEHGNGSLGICRCDQLREWQQ